MTGSLSCRVSSPPLPLPARHPLANTSTGGPLSPPPPFPIHPLIQMDVGIDTIPRQVHSQLQPRQVHRQLRRHSAPSRPRGSTSPIRPSPTLTRRRSTEPPQTSERSSEGTHPTRFPRFEAAGDSSKKVMPSTPEEYNGELGMIIRGEEVCLNCYVFVVCQCWPW